MRNYNSYKDSDIEWIGEIPAHWELKRFKYLFFEHPGNGFPHQMQGKSDDEIPFFKVSDINGDGDYIERSNNYVSFEDVALNRWNIVPAKSILAAKIGEALKKNHRKITSIQCVIDNNCLGIEPVGLTKKYGYYLLLVIDFDWFTNPGAVPSISMDKLRNFSFPISPDKEEQTAIAAYLDRKTAEIDELIADKKRLLEHYQEEKSAIINQAVTKGLDPNVPMKDSGIEWLGEVPEHWEVKKLKYVVTINDEVLTEKTDEDYEIEYVEISGVKSGYGIVETLSMFFKNAPSRARRIVKDGDVLVSTVRTYLKSIAKIDNPPNNLVASTGFAVIRPRGINSEYTGHLFYSESLIGKIISLSTGVSYPAINSIEIGNINIPVPPLEEQKAIASHIAGKNQLLTKQKLKTEKLIHLLTEYRTALISEVVTGKIKVVE